jgi:hypothetical protein
MAAYTPQNINSTEYYGIVGATSTGGGSPIVGKYYNGEYDWPPPKPVKAQGEEIKSALQGRKAVLYSIDMQYSSITTELVPWLPLRTNTSIVLHGIEIQKRRRYKTLLLHKLSNGHKPEIPIK